METMSSDSFGPSHRWVVFVCATTGHPVSVGYTKDQRDGCGCGCEPLAILVNPVDDHEQAAFELKAV